MDTIDLIYKLRNMADKQADELREEIRKAQETLDKLELFADETEEAAGLLHDHRMAKAKPSAPPPPPTRTVREGP